MKSTVALLITLLLLTGCSTEPSGFLPQESAKYSLENTEKFRLLDPTAQAAIACTGLQENSADGRLAVVANLKNRRNERVRVQVRCVFTDAMGQVTGDDTPWQLLALEPEATQAVRYAAVNGAARQYTLFVRTAP